MRRTACTLALVALAAMASPAGAQPQGGLPGDQAVAFAQQGLAAYQAGKWDEAYARFESADRLASSPVFRLYMARAKRNDGKLIDARAIFRTIVAEPLREGAVSSWTQAHADARAELTSLEPTIPSLVVRAPSAGATIHVDGLAVRAGEPVEVDPGPRRVVAKDGSRVVAETTVEIRVGERDREVVLGSSPTPAAPGTAPTAPPPGPRPSVPPPLQPAESAGSLLPGAVLVGGGALALVAGAVTGALAFSYDSEIGDRCPGGVCSVADRSAISDDQDAMLRLADTSTATLIIGGALAAAGVVLLVVRPGGSSTTGSVRLGPGGVVVAGRFGGP